VQAIRASLSEAGVVDDSAIDQALVAGLGAAQPEEVTDDEQPEARDQTVIGSKLFKLDEKLLDNHLETVFDWWYGVRPPKGVDIEDSGRCRSCEYRDDCEWRASKAREALKRACSPGAKCT